MEIISNLKPCIFGNGTVISPYLHIVGIYNEVSCSFPINTNIKLEEPINIIIESLFKERNVSVIKGNCYTDGNKIFINIENKDGSISHTFNTSLPLEEVLKIIKN